MHRVNANALTRAVRRCWKRSKTRRTRSSGCCRVHDDAVSSVYRGDVGQLSTSIERHTSHLPPLPSAPPRCVIATWGIYSRRVLSRVVRWTLVDFSAFLPFSPPFSFLFFLSFFEATTTPRNFVTRFTPIISFRVPLDDRLYKW